MEGGGGKGVEKREGSGRRVTGSKLIEVAPPLETINKTSAREKSIRYGYPGTLHLWRARPPLAARADEPR